MVTPKARRKKKKGHTWLPKKQNETTLCLVNDILRQSEDFVWQLHSQSVDEENRARQGSGWACGTTLKFTPFLGVPLMERLFPFTFLSSSPTPAGWMGAGADSEPEVSQGPWLGRYLGRAGRSYPWRWELHFFSILAPRVHESFHTLLGQVWETVIYVLDVHIYMYTFCLSRYLKIHFLWNPVPRHFLEQPGTDSDSFSRRRNGEVLASWRSFLFQEKGLRWLSRKFYLLELLASHTGNLRKTAGGVWKDTTVDVSTANVYWALF